MSICYIKWKKNSWGFKYLSIKSTHYDLQKCIIWPKKSKKGKKEKKKKDINLGPHWRKLNILLETR
jgi:hypothetical protein